MLSARSEDVGPQESDRTPSIGTSDLACECMKFIDALSDDQAACVVDAVLHGQTAVAAKLRSYQGKPIHTQDPGPMATERSSLSGVSELQHECERLLESADPSTAVPLVDALLRSNSAVAATLRKRLPQNVLDNNYVDNTILLGSPLSIAHQKATAASEGHTQNKESGHVIELVGEQRAKVRTELANEIILREQRDQMVFSDFTRQIFPEDATTQTSAQNSGRMILDDLGTGEEKGRECKDPHTNEAWTQHHQHQKSLQTGGEGRQEVWRSSAGSQSEDESSVSANGGLDALEGSYMQGSGKALIRNGRIHLLEWKPLGDRDKFLAENRVLHDQLAPWRRPRSVTSNYSDQSAVLSNSPYSAENGRRRGWRAKTSGPEGWMDHVKMRQAAADWLSAQEGIRNKFLSLLPIPHGTKSARVSVPSLQLSALPRDKDSQADPDRTHKRAELAADQRASERSQSKDWHVRGLRLRNLWKGDLQTERDGCISLHVLARVLGVPLPAKRHDRKAQVPRSMSKGQSNAKKRSTSVKGGIFFPDSCDLSRSESERDGLKGASGSESGENTSAHKVDSQAPAASRSLNFHELSDVFKALETINSTAPGRVEIRKFLDFVYTQPKQTERALPPRPRTALTNHQNTREKEKNPCSLDPAWTRELAHVYRRCCLERSLPGMDMATFLKAIHAIGLAQDCVSGGGFKGVSVKDAREQYATSLQEVDELGGLKKQDFSQTSTKSVESWLAHGHLGDASKTQMPSMHPDPTTPGEATRTDEVQTTTTQDPNQASMCPGESVNDEKQLAEKHDSEGERPESSLSNADKTFENGAQGVMSMQQFIHAVQALVVKGGKIASSLVQSRMRPDKAMDIHAQIRADGDEQEYTEAHKSRGKKQVEYDLLRGQNARSRGFSAKPAVAYPENGGGIGVSSFKVGRKQGVVGRRRPRSALARSDSWAQMNHDASREHASLLSRDDADLLRSLYKHEAQELQERRECVNALRSATQQFERNTQAILEVQHPTGASKSMLENAMTKVYPVRTGGEGTVGRGLPSRQVRRPQNSTGHALSNSHNGYGFMNERGDQYLDRSPRGSNVGPLVPSDTRIKWRPSSASKQRTDPALLARESVQTINRMIGRDPRASDCVH